MDLTQIKTPSGKTIQDFKIPEKMLQNDPALVELVMRSESMNDSERQYWFNLSEVMNTQQVEKLRDILTRERQKLAEIDAKYNKKQLDPAEAQKQAKLLAEQRAAKQQSVAQKEQAHEAEEAAKEAEALAELEAL